MLKLWFFLNTQFLTCQGAEPGEESSNVVVIRWDFLTLDIIYISNKLDYAKVQMLESTLILFMTTTKLLGFEVSVYIIFFYNTIKLYTMQRVRVREVIDVRGANVHSSLSE